PLVLIAKDRNGSGTTMPHLPSRDGVVTAGRRIVTVQTSLWTPAAREPSEVRVVIAMRDDPTSSRRYVGVRQPADDPVADVTFSQAARLQLDELLEQLMLRARGAQDAQGRLRGLLHA